MAYVYDFVDEDLDGRVGRDRRNELHPHGDGRVFSPPQKFERFVWDLHFYVMGERQILVSVDDVATKVNGVRGGKFSERDGVKLPVSQD